MLINKAGYACAGPVKTVPLASVRRQFDVNLIGLVGVTQAVLPGMRKSGSGRIVNVSSVAGILSCRSSAFTAPQNLHLKVFRTRCGSNCDRLALRWPRWNLPPSRAISQTSRSISRETCYEPKAAFALPMTCGRNRVRRSASGRSAFGHFRPCRLSAHRGRSKQTRCHPKTDIHSAEALMSAFDPLRTLHQPGILAA